MRRPADHGERHAALLRLSQVFPQAAVMLAIWTAAPGPPRRPAAFLLQHAARQPDMRMQPQASRAMSPGGAPARRQTPWQPRPRQPPGAARPPARPPSPAPAAPWPPSASPARPPAGRARAAHAPSASNGRPGRARCTAAARLLIDRCQGTRAGLARMQVGAAAQLVSRHLRPSRHAHCQALQASRLPTPHALSLVLAGDCRRSQPPHARLSARASAAQRARPCQGCLT